MLVSFCASLKVVDVEDSGDKKGNAIWYNVKLENGWIYKRASSIPLDWVGKVKDFIVTTDVNDDGTVKTDKDGKEKRSFRAPKEDDWTLLKKKTEYTIDISGNTVGEYIYRKVFKGLAVRAHQPHGSCHHASCHVRDPLYGRARRGGGQ